MVQRGEIPHFFFSENRRQHGLAARELTEKLVKTGGTPFLSAFWPFLASLMPLLECKILKKSVTYPLGMSSEVIWRVYLGPGDTTRKIHPQKASDLAP